jgi:hypothetical protein
MMQRFGCGVQNLVLTGTASFPVLQRPDPIGQCASSVCQGNQTPAKRFVLAVSRGDGPKPNATIIKVIRLPVQVSASRRFVLWLRGFVARSGDRAPNVCRRTRHGAVNAQNDFPHGTVADVLGALADVILNAETLVWRPLDARLCHFRNLDFAKFSGGVGVSLAIEGSLQRIEHTHS